MKKLIILVIALLIPEITFSQDIDYMEYYGEFGRQYLSNSDIKVLRENPKEYGVPREDNKAFARIKDLFGEMELEKYREKRYKGMLRRIKQEKVMSRPPFGYTVNDEGGLMIDESKRGLIRRLFGEFDNPFASLKTLSLKYNIPVSTLRNIRSNPVYRTGEVRWAGKIAYYIEPVVPENKDRMLDT